jgi:alanine-glyoxylate transaminase/serine-glyoxylate transaminase/serine-pyruvate transaminase
MKGRKLLMIPGPVEFEPAVMRAMGSPTTSHIAPSFIEEFGQALERMRQVFLCAKGQPFIVAGSGTLAMDLAGANLAEPGDAALVVNTGYFGDRFGALLERYGARVDHVRAAVGDAPALEQVETALKAKPYKLVTITQVDTSTGVLADVAGVARLAQAAGALVIVDGVCSVGGEELRMDDWGIDLALTASQKALATPPGLALVMAGPRAMAAWRARKTPVSNYYADWNNWLPIMEAYEARKPSYFGTPAVNLVYALNVSLGQILAEGMEARFARHRKLSAACKAAVEALGLGQLPVAGKRANTMTAPLYPAGVDASVLAKINAAGAILAGGLHPAVRNSYFRIGHMGPNNAADILGTIAAIETGLAQAGYVFEPGAGLAAAQRVFLK